MQINRCLVTTFSARAGHPEYSDDSHMDNTKTPRHEIYTSQAAVSGGQLTASALWTKPASSVPANHSSTLSSDGYNEGKNFNMNLNLSFYSIECTTEISLLY